MGDFVSLPVMSDRAASCASAVGELPGGAERWLRRVGGLHAASGAAGFFWLDSASVGPRLGRYSFAGADPWAIGRLRGGRFEISVARPGPASPPLRGEGDALTLARALMPERPVCPEPLPVPFAGGVVAAIGYESIDTDRIGLTPEPHPADLDDATLLGVDRVYAFDHLESRAWAIALGTGATPEEAARAADATVRSMSASDPDADPPPGWPAGLGAVPAPAVLSGFDEAAHERAVLEVKGRIVAGDVYQACLTHRLQVPFEGDPWRLYGALRSRNPAPFGAYLALPGVTVVGSSPERFLSAGAQGWLESRPIKGTRPRSDDVGRDRALREELKLSDKDRAENLMIVDLVRNDLGRVAELGSVHVPELFHVEAHPSVHQLVSTIRARLGPGFDVLDAVRAAFPPGSMTGAPKRAAMEILRGLEDGRRGPYSGALGYLDARGGADLSVVIRTILVEGGVARLHTGGGIVHDSVPSEEWKEAGDKVRVLLEAVAAVSAAARSAA